MQTHTVSGKARAIDTSGMREGKTTTVVEKLTSTLPSATWLTLAGGAIVGALALKMMKRDVTAIFVGEWAPTFLLIGIYNKLVKLLGSERAVSSY